MKTCSIELAALKIFMDILNALNNVCTQQCKDILCAKMINSFFMAHNLTQKIALYNTFENALFDDASNQTLKSILTGFNPEDYLKFPIIFDLITEKKIILLNDLHQMHIPFSYKNTTGANALHVACGVSGNLETAIFLYQNNILTDVNAQTDEGETPFLLAIMYEHIDIIKYFLNNAQPDLTIQTRDRQTAFSYAQHLPDKIILNLLDRYQLNTKL